MRRLFHQLCNLWLFGVKYPWVRTGSNIVCQLSVRFWSQNRSICIGSRVGIGFHCIFQTDIAIGDDVMIGSYAAFVNSDDHRYDVVGKVMRESGRGDGFGIVIEDDVWIGFGAIVMAPAYICRGSIVGAGSLVRGRVEPYSIVAGVPARLVKMRFSTDQISQHEALLAEGRKRSTEAL